MSESKAKGKLVAAAIWLVIIGLLFCAWRFIVSPKQQKKLEEATSSDSQYKHEITFAADSFSGYAVFRSPALKSLLRTKGIRFNVVDDKADYLARIKSVKDGSVQMAVFTIDSLVTASAKLGEFPATIVLIIDESKGADAILAYKTGVANIQDLDNPDARVVLTPSSPSEFLARVVVANFSLPKLSPKWIVEADGSGEVYKKFKSADEKAKTAYVMWEPDVSRALANKNALVLLDSSKLKGFIVDVVVSSRQFLKEHPDLVQEVAESYERALYSYEQDQDGMAKLIQEDAKISEQEAAKLKSGVRWYNTLENYAAFGLLSDVNAKVIDLEDMITNITRVLFDTGALSVNPLQGKSSSIFYHGVLKKMKDSGFHPGRRANIIEGIGPGIADTEKVRTEEELPKLGDKDWDKLISVGEMRVKPISFGRGVARIHVESERELIELSQDLKSWPSYYLTVLGNARSEGDAEANLKLAQERAGAVYQFLRTHGVHENRLRTKAAVAGGGSESQSVSFVLGQMPY